MNINLMNGMSLAYMGDAVYEIEVRRYFIEKGNTNVNNLHKLVTKYTSGKSQAYLITQMLNKGILLPDEEEAFRHGRNSHVSSRRKNINIQTYLLATGFEAVFGYLYFKEKKDRINELINYIFSVGEIPNE